MLANAKYPTFYAAEKAREIMRTPNIIHVLADGKRVNSIEGHVIPEDNPVYEIILRAKRGEKSKKWEKDSIAG